MAATFDRNNSPYSADLAFWRERATDSQIEEFLVQRERLRMELLFLRSRAEQRAEEAEEGTLP